MKEQAHWLGKEAPATGVVQLEALGGRSVNWMPQATALGVSLNLDMQLWAPMAQAAQL